jgi:hypothetical protein
MSYFPFLHVAGTTMNFSVTAPGFPSTEGWTLRYYLTARFTTPTQAQITFEAAANTDGTYQIQLSPFQTNWAAGAYGWRREVQKGDEKHALTGAEEQGEVDVRANPTALTQGYDSRSHARKVLAAIEASLEGRATSADLELVSYTIGDRSQTFAPGERMEQLLELHSKYKWLVDNEDARARLAAGLPNPRNVFVRFIRR